MLPAGVRLWATVHAGLDVEVQVEGVMPRACAGRLDIFTPELMPAGSVRRARERTAAEDATLAWFPMSLALAEATFDAIVVVFSAHESRSSSVREQLFEMATSMRSRWPLSAKCSSGSTPHASSSFWRDPAVCRPT